MLITILWIRRLDDDLIVEYEGESHEDYPGGNEGYSFNFEHNYVEGLIRDMVNEKVEQIEGGELMTEFTPGTRPPGPDCEDKFLGENPLILINILVSNLFLLRKITL